MKYQIGFMALIFSILLFPSCHPCETEETITQIKYGTSFGECFGYCINSITLNDGISDSEHIYSGGAQNKYCSESYDQWVSLTASIDFNEFKQLDETIGCPDCADGGAEWIAITSGEETYTITFEYLNAPNTISGYIQELRDQMSLMSGICL